MDVRNPEINIGDITFDLVIHCQPGMKIMTDGFTGSDAGVYKKTATVRPGMSNAIVGDLVASKAGTYNVDATVTFHGGSDGTQTKSVGLAQIINVTDPPIETSESVKKTPAISIVYEVILITSITMLCVFIYMKYVHKK